MPLQLSPSPTPAQQAFIDKHSTRLQAAVDAIHARTHYEAYPENPKAYPAEGKDAGQARFDQQLNQKFDRLLQDAEEHITSQEVSPYTLEPLGIQYPRFTSPSRYLKNASDAAKAWKAATPATRAGVLIESLERFQNDFYEECFATMHTTGQGFMMAFQASGPHAADRALEAVAMGYEEQTRYPNHVSWTKNMGKYEAQIEKHYLNVPKGINLNIGCSTFPVWNSLPGLYAGLITGNPVILKPHPMAIYPVAIVAQHIQHALQEAGFNPHIVQVAVDTREAPITKQLAEADAVKLIDFTGSSTFGDYVESLPGKITFTEKSGVNTVLIDSVQDVKKMAQNIAFSVSLYSGQMCTAPQNIFIPKEGVAGPEGHISYEELVAALTGAIKGLNSHEKAGPAVAGAIQSEATAERVKSAQALGLKVLLEPFAIPNPEFPKARTSSPLVLEVPADQYEQFAQELFGPIVLIIPTDGTKQSLALATKLAELEGAITGLVYTHDDASRDHIAESLISSGVPTSFNLYGQVYVNQNASFSDLHVSGGNPAGNASFTNPEFVVKRYTTVELKLDTPPA